MTQHKTRYSLLARAVEMDDERAWEELFTHYRFFMYHILGTYKITGHDADDLVQDIMLTLVEKLKSYDQEKGQFRKWLGRVISNACLMKIRKGKTLKAEMNRPTDLDGAYESMAKESDLEARVEKEWKRYMAQLALQRITKDFHENTIKAFTLLLDGKEAPEVAEELGFSVSTVYMYKGRVKRALMAEIANLADNYEM